jgi:uncharacterized protein (TIRG00374 family)
MSETASETRGLHSQRHAGLRRIAGVLISLVVIVILVERADLGQTRAALSDVRAAWLLAAAVLVTGCYLLQTVRWRLLLALDRPLSFWRAFGMLMIGFLSNVVLPLRAGDLIRPVLVRRWLGHGTARAVTSIVVERMLDVLVLSLYGLTMIGHPRLPPLLRWTLIVACGSVTAGTFVLLWISTRGRDMVHRISAFAATSRPHLWKAAADRLEEVILAVREIGRPTRLGAVLVISVAQWGLVVCAMIACLRAFALSLPPGAGILFTVATNLASAIPSAPASLGVFHGAGVIALGTWDVPLSRALAVSLIAHALMVGLQILFGFPAAWIEGGLAPLREAARERGATHDAQDEH